MTFSGTLIVCVGFLYIYIMRFAVPLEVVSIKTADSLERTLIPDMCVAGFLLWFP